VSDLVASLPILARIGIVMVLTGLVVDVAYHFVATHPSVSTPCCGPGFVGHTLTLAGMVVSFVGAVVTGLRHRTRPHRPQERRS
jgi:uncharacterized membrane protein